MPVSNISVVGVRFSTVGAGRWIGQRSSLPTSPPRSIGSPRTLKMRPSVARPTGTVIGPPVSSTSMPRASPSVESIATARTRSSPRCCWTSQTRIPSSPRSIVIAKLISGSCSGKTASMTTPWISSMRPTFLIAVADMCGFLLGSSKTSRQSLSAADDLHDLLRDLRLAGAVHLEREVVDDVAGVVGGAAHRGHARTQLRRGRLQQRPVDRDLDVVRHEPLEDLLRLRLVLDERVVPGRRGRLFLRVGLKDRRLLERQQRLAPHLLRDRRDVAVVEDLDAIDLAVDVGGAQAVGDLTRV